MIPINLLQASIYNSLNKKINSKVYDDVPQEALMPFTVIGDYTLTTLDTKDLGYSFEWKLDVYTEYEGKKEVNNIISDIEEAIRVLDGANIGNFEIDSISINNASAYRQEGYYLANITLKIEIEEVA